MSSIFRKFATLIVGASVFASCFAGDIKFESSVGVSVIAPAQARVGRPLTPVSYAGVARRTTRRTVAATSAAAAARPVVVAAPTTVVVATATTQTCVDTMDPNGTVTRTCK